MQEGGSIVDIKHKYRPGEIVYLNSDAHYGGNKAIFFKGHSAKIIKCMSEVWGTEPMYEVIYSGDVINRFIDESSIENFDIFEVIAEYIKNT